MNLEHKHQEFDSPCFFPLPVVETKVKKKCCKKYKKKGKFCKKCPKAVEL